MSFQAELNGRAGAKSAWKMFMRTADPSFEGPARLALADGEVSLAAEAFLDGSPDLKAAERPRWRTAFMRAYAGIIRKAVKDLLGTLPKAKAERFCDIVRALGFVKDNPWLEKGELEGYGVELGARREEPVPAVKVDPKRIPALAKKRAKADAAEDWNGFMETGEIWKVTWRGDSQKGRAMGTAAREGYGFAHDPVYTPQLKRWTKEYAKTYKKEIEARILRFAPEAARRHGGRICALRWRLHYLGEVQGGKSWWGGLL